MNDFKVNLGFDRIPAKNTCDGADISPEIKVIGLIADVASIAITVTDIDAPSGAFTHWIIWDIEPTDFIPEDIPKDPVITEPVKASQGSNNFGRIGYSGPCPPRGKPHRYSFKVYGLDRNLNLDAGASRRDLESSMRGHILQQAEAMATYKRG